MLNRLFWTESLRMGGDATHGRWDLVMTSSPGFPSLVVVAVASLWVVACAQPEIDCQRVSKAALKARTAALIALRASDLQAPETYRSAVSATLDDPALGLTASEKAVAFEIAASSPDKPMDQREAFRKCVQAADVIEAAEQATPPEGT